MRVVKSISAAVLAPLLLLCSCAWPQDGFLAAAGPVADAQRDHFLWIVGWMMVVILPLLISLPCVLWRYRHGRGRGRYAPAWEGSRLLEVVVWGVPVCIVVILAAHLWRSTIALDPYRPLAPDRPALTVQVVALDWKFLFIYPGSGIASVNELVIPAGRPVRLQLTSGTVMQSFMIPRLAGQIYAMAGMVTQLNLLSDRTGTFEGRNTQYNGEHFAQQRFAARVVTAKRFDTWIDSVRKSGGTLDAARYAALAKPGVAAAPLFFGSVADKLFDHVLARFNGKPMTQAAASAERPVRP